MMTRPTFTTVAEPTAVPTLDHVTGRRVEVLVSCTGLADLDEFSTSDPMCVLYVKQFGQWKEYGRTEALRNTLNPKFAQSFMLDFDANFPQSLMFTIYDIDNRSTDLKHHDLVGSYETTLTDLLLPDTQVYTTCKTLRVAGDSRPRGIISITSEIVRPSKDKLALHVGAYKLGKTGKVITSKPDVYLEICRSIDNVSYHPVFRSETIHRTQKPRWRPFEIGLQRLCNGDWDRLLQFSCWHHSGTGDYKMIGRKTTSLRELNIIKPNGHYKELTLVPKKKDKHKNSVKIVTCGYLTFFKFRIDCQYSFLDFVRGGLQLRPIIGIDFTSSNGKPNENMCLHDMSAEKGNQYVEVMESLGAMVTQYNADQTVSVFGFGAKVDSSDKTSHCFPLSESWDSVHVKGIQGAIQQYKSAVDKVLFSGPTKIKPLIAMAESLAIREPTQDSQVYHVLIVITDGIVNDLDDTIERLVSVSHLPLSVIFVGVGPADFALMDIFSHHSVHPLSLDDKHQTRLPRKHTHFVAYRRDKGLSVGIDITTKEAFAVLSTQIVDYMKSTGIVPNPPQLTVTESHDHLVDLEDEVKDTVSLRSRRSFSNLSEQSLQRTTEKSGPTCPTCGSVLEPGSFLYSEMASVI